MGRQMRRFIAPKRKAAKPVPYELISRDEVVGAPMYRLLDELVAAHHDHLREARIALAWALAWKADVDGRVKLGQCKRASDLDRELAPWDFVILLRQLFWRDSNVSEAQRRALLDHELMHAARKYDAHGEPAVDARGRALWRVRKHDLEEFTAIAERHGCWKRDLELFAAALLQKARGPFVPCAECGATASPGWVVTPTPDLLGRARLERCPCWVQWAAAHAEAVSA